MQDSKFWDEIAPKYARQPIADEAAYELTLERSLSYLKHHHRVLELGCGTGSTALRIAPHVRHLHGADISPGMIEIARAKTGPAQNASFAAVDVPRALSDEGRYDAVLGFNLFHLVQGNPEHFKRIHEVLNKGGLFISKTPCLADGPWAKRMMFRAMIPVMQAFGKAPGYVRFYTRRALEAEIEAAGFEIIETLDAPALSRYIVARRS